MTTTSTFKGMGDEAKPSSRVLRPPGGGSSNIFGNVDPPAAASPAASAPASNKPADSGIFGSAAASPKGGAAAQRSARDGSYNPITGSDYNDLAPNHHALNVKETPKPQKEQPPLPGSDQNFQVREGKMQNVHTSSRITNPPGGKTHKLW